MNKMWYIKQIEIINRNTFSNYILRDERYGKNDESDACLLYLRQ